MNSAECKDNDVSTNVSTLNSRPHLISTSNECARRKSAPNKGCETFATVKNHLKVLLPNFMVKERLPYVLIVLSLPAFNDGSLTMDRRS